MDIPVQGDLDRRVTQDLTEAFHIEACFDVPFNVGENKGLWIICKFLAQICVLVVKRDNPHRSGSLGSADHHHGLFNAGSIVPH